MYMPKIVYTVLPDSLHTVLSIVLKREYLEQQLLKVAKSLNNKTGNSEPIKLFIDKDVISSEIL